MPAVEGRRIRAAVVYSTRFGTTEKVARSFEAGLEMGGLDARCASTQDSAPESLRGYDLVCIGGPTEMFSASKQMMEYLKAVKEVDLGGKLGFAFDTKLDSKMSGSASKYIERSLEDQGLYMVARRQSALVTTTREKGAIVGATLKEGEEKRFNELGRRIGDLAAQAWPR